MPLFAPTRRRRWASALRVSALHALALLAVGACATDQPSAVTEARPAQIALNASVAATSTRANLAQVRVTAAYQKQGGGTVPMGTPQLITLGAAASQQVPITLDVGPCLADDTRASAQGGPAAADECVLRLDLELLLDGVVVDRQVLLNISVKPGQVANVAQPVALSDVIDLRLVLPPANIVGMGQPLRLEIGKAMTLVLNVLDAQQKPVVGRSASWRTSNPAVATVDANGVVTGLTPGNATITADVGTQSVSADVNVVPLPQVITVASTGTSGAGAVTSTPAGVNCTVQGAQATGTCVATFPGDVSVLLVANAAQGSEFVSFTGDCALSQGATCQVPAAPTRRVNVAFRARHTLAVDATGNGSGTVTSAPSAIDCAATNAVTSGACNASFADGATVTLTATPTNGSAFTGWTGACTGTNATCTVTMAGARSASARFERLGTIAITGANGNGDGTVVSSPAGITCTIAGNATTGKCTATFPVGTAVTLTATPANGHTLRNWGADCAQFSSNNCALVVTNGSRTASIAFNGPVALSVALGGTGGGQVTGGPITCLLANGATTGVCSANVSVGTPVALTATPDGTSDFTGWSGACVGTGACNVTLAQATSVTATFKRKQVALTVTAAGPGAGSLAVSGGAPCAVGENSPDQTCSYLVDVGTTVTLNASPGTYQQFTGWSGACAGTTSCSVIVDQARSVRGAFARRKVTLTLHANGPGVGSISTNAGLTCAVVDGGPSRTCTQQVDAGRPLQLSASPDTYSLFTGFTGACSGTAICQLTPDLADVTVNADFTRRQALVTVTITGNGAGTVTLGALTPCTVAENSGGRVCTWTVDAGRPLTATAAAASSVMQFNGFTGDCAGPSPCTIFPDQTVSFGASFSRRTVNLTLNLTGTGAGAVEANSLSPCSITSNSAPVACTRTVPMGLPVTLTAQASTSNSFGGFTGDCVSVTSPCTFTPMTDAAVGASFSPQMITVTIVRAATSGGVGSILMGPQNQRCNITLTGTSGNCSATIVAGTPYTLTVDNSIGAGLQSWGGACSPAGANNVCTITPTVNTTITVRMN